VENMEVLEGRGHLKEKLRNKDFLEVFNEPCGELEESFVEVVRYFADVLKSKISENLGVSNEEIIRGLQGLKNKIEGVILENFKIVEQVEENLENTEKSWKTDEKSLKTGPENSVENPSNPCILSLSPSKFEEATEPIPPPFIPKSSDPKLKTTQSNSPISHPQETLEKEESLFEDTPSEIISNLFSRILKIFYKDGRNLQNLFESIDVSKDGKITCQELRVELVKHDQSITQEECEEVFKILDGNKDGSISLDELQKRIRLIHEKAEAEAVDPLAHLVISKALDPSLTHGSLSVILQKVLNLKPGAHSVKVKVKDSLEYLTHDTTETNPNFNFRCEFLFENKSLDEIPDFVEFELFNRGKIEGNGSFNWSKAMKSPNTFSLKVKTEAKTSTGQVRGTFFFTAKWTPIVWRENIRGDYQSIENFKFGSENHKRNFSQKEQREEKKDVKEGVEDFEEFKELSAFERSQSTLEKPGQFCYVVETTSRVIERSFTGVNKGLVKSAGQQMHEVSSSSKIPTINAGKNLAGSKINK
jgi:hypothetical protein